MVRLLEDDRAQGTETSHPAKASLDQSASANLKGDHRSMSKHTGHQKTLGPTDELKSINSFS